jgi:signal transduction histidine kinase
MSQPAELAALPPESLRQLAMIGHDLKAPLVTMRGFLSGLEDAAQQGDWELFRGDMARIARAAEQMRQLLDQLQTLAAVGDPPASATVSLGDALSSAQAAVAGRIAERHVSIHVPPDLPLVQGETVALTRVLQNLLDNALNSLSQTPEPQIDIAVQSQGGWVRVSVRDNGCGLPPEGRERLFEPRLRSDGGGLGLWIVRQLVSATGGQVGIESDGPGQGTTVWFTVPGG